MKPFVYRIMFVLSLLTLSQSSLLATTLGLGDIAFTGYNSDASASEGDDFSFVLLKDVDAGTQISFTDRGWFSTGGFRTASEGILTITLPAATCGDEFRVINTNGTSTWTLFGDAGTSLGTVNSTGTGSGFVLDGTGDQLFAYQGSVPTNANQSGFIAAIQTHGNWDANATDSFTSALPSIFSSNPGNDFAIGTNQDNGKYQCSITSGLPANIRTAIYNVSNWLFSNSSSQRFPLLTYCNFTCQAACTAPVITSLTTNSTIGSNTFCSGDAVVITVNGTANDATNWNLYSGSCGSTVVSTIPVSSNTFSFTATSTITLYVGGTGGCVATPTCTPITITVNGLTANAGSDQKINPGTTTANISGNGSGTWSIVGVGDGNGLFAGNTTTSNNATTTFTGTAGQEYILRWTVTNAGCSSSTADIVVTFLSPSTLGLGDIAFTGYNSDNPDEFRFVLLKDINAGTQITFTDNGWQTTGGLRTTENTMTVEFCRPYKCGDEFSVTGTTITTITNNNVVEAGTSTGSALALATSGDQIFAYQGSAPATGGASNWIAAIQMNGGWDTDAVDAATSAQPSAFTDGVNSISISPQADNAKYNCSITTNSPANLRAAVNNASNWTTQEAILTLDYCGFTCGSCVEPVLTSVNAPATACPGQTVALTINGTLNGANEWAIYTGSCGGTLVGTTTSSSFNVTPTATITYYVSGRGGCVVTETCQMVTISVTAFQADAGPNDVEKINGSNSTILQANGGFGDGTWSIVDSSDGEGSFSDEDDPAATFSGNAGQSYTLKWTIDNSAAGCPNTEDEVTIVFLDQTGLTLGDIAFISYSADEDDFAFVLLKDVRAGTSIKFTDRGWQAGGGFRAGEGTITVEFCRPYYCGDEFNIFNAPHEFKDADGQIAGTIMGAPLEPSTSGDQIFAYQGPETNLITGIQMNGAWDADATNTNTSAKPSMFTDGVNSISISPEQDNANLKCSAGVSAVASQINTASNWESDDNDSADLPLNCNLACCTPGVVNSINGSPGPLCPSSLQTLLVPIQASLNDDQTWVWYTGSCGGTQVNTGPNFNVSPTVTTTYYVRAEGTCSGTSGACASLTIVVEDGVDPMVSCPADINVNNGPGLCSAVVSFEATATDNCGGTVDITYSQDPSTAFNVGTTQVDVTATDDLGNTANCSFDVIVADNEAPMAVCPADIVVNNDAGQCGAIVNYSVSATDNCPGATANADTPTGSFFGIGTNIVSVTATDASGNQANCDFNVTVNDNEDPTFSNCPGPISVSNDSGQCGADVNWTPPTISDNCPAVSSNSNFSPGSFFPVGNTTVTYTGDDASGNSATNCSFVITVNDTEDPMPTCPSDITVSNDAGECSAVVDFEATASDNCDSDVDIAYSQNPNTTFNVGTTQVNVTATDNFSRTAICIFSVTVNDTEAPIAKCPGVIQDVELDLMGNGTLPANIGDGNSTDNCGSFETSPQLTFTCDDLGEQMVTLTAVDPSGNINAIDCSFNVVDNVGACNQPPVAKCKGITVSTAPNTCEASITAAQVDDNSTDPDGDPLQLSLDNSGPFATGVHTVELTVNDGSLSDKCTAMVTVKDTEAPTANCPSNVTVSNSVGQCGANVSFSIPFPTDNCPGATSAALPGSGSFFGIGTTPVTVTATDVAGNTGTCSFNVTVNDTEAPTANCPSNVTVSNSVGQCGANVSFSIPFPTDNCPGATSAALPASGSFFGIGITPVTVTATDVAGNTGTCSFNVTVNDTEAPTANCPSNVTVSNSVGQCGANVSFSIPFPTDNCPGATSAALPASGSFFGIGITPVTVTATDVAGNTGTCSFNVTVNDTEVPIFSNCPSTINVFNDAGDCGALVSWTPPGFTDNCPNATSDSSHEPGDFFDVGTTTVTYTGSDAAGNDATACSFTVSVTDNEKPNISCPANISTGTDVGKCGAEVTFTPAIANDNCTVDEIKARYRPVDEYNNSLGSWSSRVADPSGFFPVGRYQVQWRAEDIYGNKKTCSHYLDVFDDEDPVAVCKDVTVDFNGEEDISLTVSQVWNEAASSDNCGNVSYVGTSPGLSIDCDDLGNTVALTVTIEDEAGNKDQCTSYVSVIGLPCGWAEGPQDGSLNCDGDTSSDYDPHDESFTLTADGCWHDCRESDKAAFVYHELCGDGQLTARLADINTSGYAGLMARESLDPDARRAGVLKNYSTRRVRREWRAAYGGVVSQRPSNRSRVEWLRIVRQGNSIKSYTSTNGSSWRLLYKVTFPDLEDCLYFGMTAYSLSGSTEVEAVFDNVSITSSGNVAGSFGDETVTPGQFLGYSSAGNIREGEVDIFPNPASHETQIVLNGFEDKPAQIVIRDQFGRLIRQIDVDSAMGLSETIPVHDLAAGIYLVSIIQDQQATVSKKLVIQQ